MHWWASDTRQVRVGNAATGSGARHHHQGSAHLRLRICSDTCVAPVATRGASRTHLTDHAHCLIALCALIRSAARTPHQTSRRLSSPGSAWPSPQPMLVSATIRFRSAYVAGAPGGTSMQWGNRGAFLCHPTPSAAMGEVRVCQATRQTAPPDDTRN
jgi:hypothetical protein